MLSSLPFSPVATGALSLIQNPSGEDGSEFPVPSFMGCALGSLPLGCEVGILGVQPPPSSICPIHTALGGALPTSGSMESNSLETMWGTG